MARVDRNLGGRFDAIAGPRSVGLVLVLERSFLSSPLALAVVLGRNFRLGSSGSFDRSFVRVSLDPIHGIFSLLPSFKIGSAPFTVNVRELERELAKVSNFLTLEAVQIGLERRRSVLEVLGRSLK